MKDFFSTIGMDQQPTEYFFGPYHLLYFFIFLLSFALTFYLLTKFNRKWQNRIISIFLILILFMKYSVEGIFIYEYYNVFPALSKYPHPFLDVNTFISFQLCGVMNILLPIVVWFDIKPLKTFTYLTSILGGLAVVFYPVTVLFGDPFIITMPMIRSVVVHFFLVLIPLFLIYRGDLKVKGKNWYQVAIGLLSVAAWAMIGNLFIDSEANNMYLMVNPFLDGPIPVLNQTPNGWHVFILAVAVTFGYFIVFQIAKLFENLNIWFINKKNLN